MPCSPAPVYDYLDAFRESISRTEWRMSPYAVLVLVLVATVLIARVIRRARGGGGSKLPPSPPSSLPLLGHLLHLVGRLPHRALQELHLRYGGGGLLLLQLGRRRTLVVSTAAAAADLFKNHDLAFASRPRNAAADTLTYGSASNNVSFAPYGDGWRLGKKMAVVHLLSPRRAESFAPVRAAEAAALVARARRAAVAEEAVELRELLFGYSDAVVTRAATGAAGATADRLKQLMGNTAALMAGLQPEDVLPDPAAKVVRWATGLEKKLQDMVEEWDKFLSEIVAEHNEKGDKNNDGAGEEDFLDVLLRLRQEEGSGELELTDGRVKSIVKDMIYAGTETASASLEWAMAELVRNPRVMVKLQDGIAETANGKPTLEEDDLNRTEYLRAVVKEVLRLHPPAPLLLPHESRVAATVQGYEIPAKTVLFINAWAIGRDPAAWDAAEEFRPERFLGSPVDLRGNDYQLLPFGAGRRICPGISFALPVVEIALAGLVHHFDWELPAGTRAAELDMREGPGITTHPLAPLRLVPRCKNGVSSGSRPTPTTLPSVREIALLAA